MFASATGFYSIVYGATGLEKAENPVLSGEDPRLFVDRMQQLFAGREIQGGSVTTTLDGAAQQAAWDGLSGMVGSVVAIEPSTGRILAQVQSPSFDPNKLSSHNSKEVNAYYQSLEDDPDKPLLNRPIARTNPPGSTFKVVTAAAALESGRFEPDSVLPGPATYTPPGTSVAIPNYFNGPCGPDGKVTLAEALAISCNTAFAWLGNELGDDALRDQAQKFGFDESFEIPLRAATSRFPADPDEPQTAMSAIGQFDVRATTLQMAMVAAAIGNTGVTMRPGLVDQTAAPDLNALETFDPTEFATAMSPENAAQLAEMMVGVVNEGTGSNARIPGRGGGRQDRHRTDLQGAAQHRLVHLVRPGDRPPGGRRGGHREVRGRRGRRQPAGGPDRPCRDAGGAVRLTPARWPEGSALPGGLPASR